MNSQQKHQSSKIGSFSLPLYQTQVIFSSDFDSGNAKVIKQVTDLCYRLTCIDDCSSTGKPVNSRSWFYFSVQGFPKKCKGKFIITKVQALLSLYYSKYAKYYRPVYRVDLGEWKRLPQQAQLTLNESGQLECTIEYIFQENQTTVQFAFCYPYQFQRQLEYLNSLETLKNDQQIYYHKEVLVESPEKRPVHLLTITNKNNLLKQTQNEELFDLSLFPERDRPLKFKKSVVLITARVHPGQTPASYAMEGVINFLLNKQDLRAHLLRQMFVFMIVPMINVDGVFYGHFRMDIHGKNLNRFYISPDFTLQPVIYGIKQLAKHLMNSNRLTFYFDLHGHNAKKGCFIYGNAFSEFVEQVESQVFCKLFSMNHSGFQYQYCNFSQKHMNAKDRFEDLTKEGCGRVVMHKEANIIHSYSLECGIISANNLNVSPEPSNLNFTIDEKGFVKEAIEEQDYEGIRMTDNSFLFTQDSYRNLGKNLLVSILDVFDKNPYNRVYNSRYKSMQALRRITAFEIFHSTERFRMFQKSLFGKVKNINSLITDILSTKTQYKSLYNCFFQEDERFQEVEWPKNVIGLIKPFKVQISKLKKFKSISEVKAQPLEDENCMNAQGVSSFKKIEEKSKGFTQGFSLNKEDIRIDRVQTIQIQECQNMEPLDSKKQVKKSTSVFILDQDDQNDSNSDNSEVRDQQINQEILLMCENEIEQSEIISKIMHNNFDEKDYEKIQEKYKHKNTVEGEKEEKLSKVSNTTTEVIKFKSDYIRNTRSNKQPKYRVNRKMIVNTCDVSYKYKKKGEQLRFNQSKPQNNIHQSEDIPSEKKLSAGEEFRKNIYDAIKQEIKEGLRRQYDRKKHRDRVDSKLVDSFRINQNGRMKSNHNYNDIRKMKSKVKLPSLGSNMYIITTSTRVLQKN